jgi:hypothetical protein
MDGFPPSPEHQVTLANWRTSPFNRWAFHHVGEVVPSADIPNDPARVLLPSDPLGLKTLTVESSGPDPFAIGVHGQSLYVGQKHEIVIAKVSSQALPIDADCGQMTARAVSGIIRFLAASSR